MAKIVIGIDLGTTFSSIAYVDEDGRICILKTPNGQEAMPSVVLIDGDRIVVGDAALNQWAVDEEHVVRWIKRSMGDPDYQFPRRALFALDPSFEEALGSATPEDLGSDTLLDALREEFQKNDITLSSGAYLSDAIPAWVLHDGDSAYTIPKHGEELMVHEGFSAVEISAEILKALKASAESQLGQPVDEVVITCPAYFDTNEVENTKRAGEMAGMTVREIVKEPVAAAVYFGIDHMKDGEKTLTCDLGGGTFDATILTLEQGKFTSIATMGDRNLGGHDWTMELVDLVAEQSLEQFQEDPRDDPVGRQRLYEACENAKRMFLQTDQMAIPCICSEGVKEITITRDEFEARTASQVTRMMTQCEDALTKAKMTWDDIDRILLVGGSTRLRGVSKALEDASGKKPELSPKVDLMVACGAAIMAKGKVRARASQGGLTEVSDGGLIEVEVTRQIARSFGTRVYDPENSCITNAMMIPHGTEAPVDCSDDDFEVAIDGQQYFDVPVVEFEDDEDYECIRSYRCICLPDAKKGDRIRLTFHYDISGILTAEAHDVKTGSELHLDPARYVEPEEGSITVSVKPRWVVFALDVSYSMEEDDILETAKKALIDNARDLLAVGGDGCKIGIVTFASSATVACHPTSNMAEIERQVRPIKCSGTTVMDEGIAEAVVLVMSAPAGTDRDVVLLTDGYPDSGHEQKTKNAAEDAKRKGVTLSSLGIGEDGVDMDFLRSLTPLILQIQSGSEIEKGVGTLLTRAKQARSGLTEGDQS